MIEYQLMRHVSAIFSKLRDFFISHVQDGYYTNKWEVQYGTLYSFTKVSRDEKGEIRAKQVLLYDYSPLSSQSDRIDITGNVKVSFSFDNFADLLRFLRYKFINSDDFYGYDKWSEKHLVMRMIKELLDGDYYQSVLTDPFGITRAFADDEKYMGLNLASYKHCYSS